MTFKISTYTHNTSHNFGISGIEYRYFMYIKVHFVNNVVKHSIVMMMHEVLKFKMQWHAYTKFTIRQRQLVSRYLYNIKYIFNNKIALDSTDGREIYIHLFLCVGNCNLL